MGRVSASTGQSWRRSRPEHLPTFAFRRPPATEPPNTSTRTPVGQHAATWRQHGPVYTPARETTPLVFIGRHGVHVCGRQVRIYGIAKHRQWLMSFSAEWDRNWRSPDGGGRSPVFQRPSAMERRSPGVGRTVQPWRQPHDPYAVATPFWVNLIPRTVALKRRRGFSRDQDLSIRRNCNAVPRLGLPVGPVE